MSYLKPFLRPFTYLCNTCMFPFKTDSACHRTAISEEELKELLQSKVKPKKLFRITYDHQLYGKVKPNTAVFAYGQFPDRNAFRPALCLRWHTQSNALIIQSHLKLDSLYLLLLFFSILPLSGISIALEIHSPLPVIVLSLLYLILFFLVFWPIYHFSKKRVLAMRQHLMESLQAQACE